MTHRFEMNMTVKSMRCPVHGLQTVPTLVLPDGGFNDNLLRCPLCEREEQDRETAERNRLVLERRAAECNVRKEFVGKTFADYSPVTDSQQKALDAVRRLTETKKGKVVLLGGNGVGKTHLCSAAVMTMGGRIFTMYEISAMIRATYTVRADRTELELMDWLAGLPLLVIDELGRSKGGDAETNWRSYLIDRRHADGLPVIFSGNGHLGRNCPFHGCRMCFESGFGSDIISRLHEDTEIIEVTGPDHRRTDKTTENDRKQGAV